MSEIIFCLKTNTRQPHPEQKYKKMSFTSAIRFCCCNQRI